VRLANKYPYGTAAFLILMLAIASGIAHVAFSLRRRSESPDLVFAIFAQVHEEPYRRVIPEFEQKHGVKVQLQRVSSRALQSRLQSALLTGADVPDVVEVLEGSMGYFTRGPLEDVGFMDMTQRLHEEGLYERMVESRYSLWSSRGHIFAVPHDVHPVSLCYRTDLIAELGIDVSALKTWDDFVAMGRRITKDLDGDGYPDRYALDMPVNSETVIRVLALQRGGQLFDPDGRLVMDSEIVADTLAWYVRQSVGPNRIGYEAGWGQSLAKAVSDGLVLFYICPDWRTRQFELDVPHLHGKLGLIPLPAWEPGGRRTSTWGGTGLAITKACRNPELAWEFAQFLYLDKAELGKRFRAMNIVTPLKEAWDMPEFNEPRPFFGGQAIGTLYAELAPETPPYYMSPYVLLANGKLLETYLSAAARYRDEGEEGLDEYVRDELRRNADYVRKIVARNVFLKATEEDGDGA